MKKLILTIALATVSSCVLFAEDPAVAKPVNPETKPAVIQKRKQVQQKRIAKGVENGSLTAKETAKIEAREAHLNKKIAEERAANGGKLTQAQRRQAARRQDAISKDIAKEKHDAQVQK